MAVDDWADLLYRPEGHLAHLVPFGGAVAVCGALPASDDWRGTGSQEERDHADQLPKCLFCAADANVKPADWNSI